jgi:hypothetical protein
MANCQVTQEVNRLQHWVIQREQITLEEGVVREVLGEQWVALGGAWVFFEKVMRLWRTVPVWGELAFQM